MLLFLWLMAFGHSKPFISPSKLHAIAAGSTVEFKASVPVRWSLGPNSPGRIDQNGVYHAPSHVPVHNEMAGCQVLPNDHILNTRIDGLPLNAKSAEWNALLPKNHVLYFESWGINIATSHTPTLPLHFLYSPENNGPYEVPDWPDLQRENGVFSSPLSNVDRHVVTVDRESCRIFEIYNNYPPGTNPTCKSCTAQGGVSYDSMSYELPQTSSDAAGLFLAPLSLRLSDIQSGHIQHALRVTLGNAYIAPSSAWPSLAHAGAWGKVPYGTRFRLRPDYNDASFDPIAKVLIRQLKEYGLMVADGGANWEIDTATDVTVDPAVEAALLDLGRHGPGGGDFQAVDESGLMTTPDSGQVKPGSQGVQDEGAVTIIATDEAEPNKVSSVRIPLEAVTVGVPRPAVWIQSGVKTRFEAWVNGTGDKATRWSMSRPLGTIDADGGYTAPVVDHPSMTRLIAASHADPEARGFVDLTVMPPGPIRVDVGNATSAPDEPHMYAPDFGPDWEGHMWWHDMAGEVSWGVVNDDWFGGEWPNQKDIGLFYTSRYSMGDMVYRFLVPNGNYKISLYFARPGCKGKFPEYQIAPIHIEAQGQIIFHDFDPGAAEKYTCDVPSIESIPATVTDNSLYFALRRITLPPNLTPTPLLTAYSITRDNSPPRLAITPEHPRNVIAGDRLHLYPIGWYMDNRMKWSMSGPGSIDGNGSYSARNVSPARNTEVKVKAQSISDPSRSAEITLTLESTPLVISPQTVKVTISLSQIFVASFGRVPDKNVEWSLKPQLGTITQEGVYTGPDSLAVDTTISVIARSRDLTDRTATATVYLKAAPDTIRIKCGEGAGFKDAQGNVWSSDYGYSKDTVTYTNAVPIASAPPDMQPLYQSSRYRYQSEPFDYTFDLPDGRYAVTLKFADYAHTEAGHYAFDVRLNGKKVLSNFDPDLEHGPKTANDKTFETEVTNKKIRIDFLAEKDAAFINGIEIRYLGR